MSWNDLTPAVKTSGTPMVSIIVKKLKGDRISATLFLASTFIDPYSRTVDLADGGELRAGIQFGSGDDEGQLRVYFRNDGPFRIAGGPRGSGRVTLPDFDTLPKGERPSHPCAIISQDKDSFVVQLPIKEWTSVAEAVASGRARAAANPAVAVVTASPAPAPDNTATEPLKRLAEPSRHASARSTFDQPSAGHSLAAKIDGAETIDMVRYLTKKGHECRTQGEQYVVDSELLDKHAMLGRVNHYRAAANLKAVTIRDVV